MALQLGAESRTLQAAAIARRSGSSRYVRALAIGYEPELLARLRRAMRSDVQLTLASSREELRARTGDLVLLMSSAEVPWRHLRVLSVANVPVLVVVERWSDEDEWRALDSGAMGYLSLDAEPTALARGVDAALRGEFVFRRRALGRWFRRGFPEPVRPTCLRDLTRRQQQIASLLTTGTTDKEIAARLGISVATVQKHVSRLLRTLGAANRAAAVWVILGRARELRNAEPN